MQPLLQFTGDQISRNSPMFSVPKQRAPLIVTYGGAEPSEFARQSRDYFQAWDSQGNPGELWPQPDANHFTAIYGLEDAKSPLCKKLLRLMSVSDRSW